MFVGNSARRWIVVTVAAYAMVLHALVMGVVSAPRASASEGQGLIGALQELCSGGYLPASPDDPGSSTMRAMPCSLCSLGHAAADMPPAMRVAAPVNIIETVGAPPCRRSRPAAPRFSIFAPSQRSSCSRLTR